MTGPGLLGHGRIVVCSLEQLAGRLLIQCRSGQAAVAAEVAALHGGGLVITGKSAEPAARLLLDNGFDGPILCDADRYSGQRRLGAGRGITPAWCRRQRELGLVPLSDSGYLGARNLFGLRSILRATALQEPPVIAMLPLAARWFATTSVCDALAGEINQVGVPVAVAVEHSADPFAVQYVLRNFLRLLHQVEVPLLLMRSDVSAIGALCHGAHAAAIGTSSTLRHIYPQQPAHFVRRPAVAAFVTPLLGYHSIDTIKQIVEGMPEHLHLWTCHCSACQGGTPADLGDSSEEAFRHSLDAQLQLHAELLRARTREALISTWHEHCSHALYVHAEVAQALHEKPRPPAGLRSWLAVTRDPMQDGRTIHVQPQDGTARQPAIEQADYTS